MLKRKYRLSKEVKFKAKNSFQAELFVFKTNENKLDLTRFGFVVSKKIDKRAVVRNRIKRILRKGIEDIVEEIKPGYDMLFIAKKNILAEDSKQVFLKVKEELKSRNFLK